LTRFLVTCCVADAVPIGIRVVGAGAENVSDNSWQIVEGTVTWEAPRTISAPGRVLADLQADRIDASAAPADPYIY
jgi:uncharacterized membrane protein YcgQ (UPF0703/DUF1980 family)